MKTLIIGLTYILKYKEVELDSQNLKHKPIGENSDNWFDSHSKYKR